MKIKQIELDSAERSALGRAYVGEIEHTIQAREQLHDTWRLAQENYEGKAPKIDWPLGPDASSNAFVPISATHTSAIYARLYNTATGQDPIYLLQLVGEADLDGITSEEFSMAWEDLSAFIEDEIRVKDVMALTLLVMVKYGDSIIYLPWRSQLIKDRDLDPETGEWVEREERELFGRPSPHILHPENFFIPHTAHGPGAIQEAPWCAYEFELDYNQIEAWVQSDFYTVEEGTALKQLLRPDPLPPKEESAHYLTDRGDTRISPLGTNDLMEDRERLVGIDETLETHSLKMYHVWTREDMDGDDISEEINFHVHAKTGMVPHISWNPYMHRKRPFVRFQYEERDGIFYSIGVPEMLFNIQAILNQAMRDIMNNNKVQNTKVFLAPKNSGLDPKMKVWPGRFIFLDDVSQFVPVDLGSGKPVTSVMELMQMQQWGERRTGISDFALGQEDTKRTPASTVLSRLEQSNIRIDLIVRRMRESQNELWDQVLSLYAQFGFGEEALDILKGEEAEVIRAAIQDMSVEQIRKKLRFRARTSTQNLNRAVRREEALTMFGQLQAFYEQILGLATVISQTLDPNFRELFLAMAKGYRKTVMRFLDTFDEHEKEELTPDLEKFLDRLLGGAPDGLPTPSGQQNGSGSQVGQAINSALNNEGAFGPANPTGRPTAGLPRIS